MQSDQGLRCPLILLVDIVEYIDTEVQACISIQYPHSSPFEFVSADHVTCFSFIIIIIIIILVIIIIII